MIKARPIPSLLLYSRYLGRIYFTLSIIQLDVTVLTTHQSSLGLDKRPILSVHFIVKTTGITEIMAISISPPQWSGSGPAVDTLSTLWKEKY